MSQVFLSFAFAPDEDMSWDPSVELLQHAEGNSYLITVGNTQCKTLEILQDHGTHVLLSRVARIFKVKKVGDNQDNVYVLKGLWVEQDRNLERQIYEEIICDIRCLYSEGGQHH